MNKIFVFLVLIILIGCTAEVSTQKVKEKNVVETKEDISEIKNNQIKSNVIKEEINNKSDVQETELKKEATNKIDKNQQKSETRQEENEENNSDTTNKITSEITNEDAIKEEEKYQYLGNIICLNENQVVLLEKMNCETDFDCTYDVLRELCNPEFDYELTFEDYFNETSIPDCAVKVICEQGVCQAVCEI